MDKKMVSMLLEFEFWSFPGAWRPARDLSELELGALPSPFPPFAPVTSVFIRVHLWLFPFDLALVSARSSRLCGELISNHSVNSSGFFLSHFSVPNFSVSRLNSPLRLL